MPYIGTAVLIIDIAIVAYFCYYKQYFKNCVGLLRIGIKYIKENPMLIFLSIIFFVIWVLVIFFEVLALLFIYSIDSNSPQPGSTAPYTFAYFVNINNVGFVKTLLVFTLIHFVWTLLLLHSIIKYLTMASASYWICNVKCNFKNALYSLLKFHLGSVIKGSILNIIPGKIVNLSYMFLPRANSVYCRCCYCPYLSQCFRHKNFK